MDTSIFLAKVMSIYLSLLPKFLPSKISYYAIVLINLAIGIFLSYYGFYLGM